MKIVPVEHGLSLGENSAQRSAGLHLSTIYNDLYQDLEPKRYGRGIKPDPLRLEMGLSLEMALEGAIKRRLTAADRPEEVVTKEGIICSPDQFIFDPLFRIGEIKLTWMSSRDVPRKPTTNSFPPRFNKWFTQLMNYCHAAQTPYGRLYGFFVNGNYKPPSPELLAWDFEFSKQEMNEAWATIINHARSKEMLL